MTPQIEYYSIIPRGLCQCGCGGVTKIASETNTAAQHVKGLPIRFISGHQGKRFYKRRDLIVDGELCSLIPLTCGHDAIVDADNYEYLSRWNWHWVSGRKNYAGRGSKFKGINRTVRMHHEIRIPIEGFVIDHKNGNGLDNRLSNLRYATAFGNQQNRGANKGSFTGLKGVCYRPKARLYEAKIMADRKKIHIGYFKTASDAAAAYNQKSLELHGEFAFQNEVSQ